MTADEEETFTTFNEFRSDTFTVPTRAMVEDGFMNATFVIPYTKKTKPHYIWKVKCVR